MKNLKISKAAIALLMAGSIALFSGCNMPEPKAEEPKEKLCTHATVYFGVKAVTFKECDGYNIKYGSGYKTSQTTYEINKDGKCILEGATDHFNFVDVLHSVIDEEFDVEELKKSK